MIEAGGVDVRSIVRLRIHDYPILHWAIMQKNAVLVRTLVEHHADLEEAYNNKTTMELAAVAKSWDIVEIIAKARKADSEDKAHYGIALVEAIKYNQVDTVAALLAADTPLNHLCPVTGYNLLGFAVQLRHVAITKLLLLYGLDPDHKGTDNKTIFELVNDQVQESGAPALAVDLANLFAEYQQDDSKTKSFENGYNYKRLQFRKTIQKNTPLTDKILLDIFRLYDDCISPDWVMPDMRQTLLSLAIHCNAVDTVTHLLTKNPDLLKDHNYNADQRHLKKPIMQAACLQYWPIVEILGKHKQKDRDYSTINGEALVIAANSDQLVETARVLLEAGASTKNNCLRVAVNGLNEKMATLLLQHGADLQALGDRISVAAYNKRWSLVKIIAQNIKTDSKDTAGYGGALNHLLESDIANHRDVAIALIDAGAPVDFVIRILHDGKTLLFWAISHDDEQFVRLALTHGADLSQVNKAKLTPIEAAYEGNQLHLVRIIAANRATNAEDKARYTNVLVKAIDKGQIDLVKLLVSAGVPIDQTLPGPPRTTLLDRAVCCANDPDANIVKFLLEKGAIPTGRYYLTHRNSCRF